MAILVSGGAGYIGSHTCVELLAAGYDIVVADNFYNSCPKAVERVKQISGKDFRFYEADMTKAEDVEKVFAENPDIDSVIHFAAYKAVGESVAKPLEYYTDNLTSTLVVLAAMRKHGVLLLRHRVRRPRQRAHQRELPRGRRHQPLWRHQGDERTDSDRLLQGRP